MRFSSLCLAAAVIKAATAGVWLVPVTAASTAEKDASSSCSAPPFVSPKLMIDGAISTSFEGDDGKDTAKYRSNLMQASGVKVWHLLARLKISK